MLIVPCLFVEGFFVGSCCPSNGLPNINATKSTMQMARGMTARRAIMSVLCKYAGYKWTDYGSLNTCRFDALLGNFLIVFDKTTLALIRFQFLRHSSPGV